MAEDYRSLDEACKEIFREGYSVEPAFVEIEQKHIGRYIAMFWGGFGWALGQIKLVHKPRKAIRVGKKMVYCNVTTHWVLESGNRDGDMSKSLYIGRNISSAEEGSWVMIAESSIATPMEYSEPPCNEIKSSARKRKNRNETFENESESSEKGGKPSAKRKRQSKNLPEGKIENALNHNNSSDDKQVAAPLSGRSKRQTTQDEADNNLETQRKEKEGKERQERERREIEEYERREKQNKENQDRERKEREIREVEEKKKSESERMENEKRENERKENERKESERKESERKESERKENERKENERKENERKENERKENERKEIERRENERKESERKESERKESERKESERRENERKENEKKENERKENERRENENRETECKRQEGTENQIPNDESRSNIIPQATINQNVIDIVSSPLPPPPPLFPVIQPPLEGTGKKRGRKKLDDMTSEEKAAHYAKVEKRRLQRLEDEKQRNAMEAEEGNILLAKTSQIIDPSTLIYNSTTPNNNPAIRTDFIAPLQINLLVPQINSTIPIYLPENIPNQIPILENVNNNQIAEEKVETEVVLSPRALSLLAVLNCNVCNIDENEDKVLLCDTCNKAYHTYCFNPPIAEIPEGDWFCSAICLKAFRELERRLLEEQKDDESVNESDFSDDEVEFGKYKYTPKGERVKQKRGRISRAEKDLINDGEGEVAVQKVRKRRERNHDVSDEEEKEKQIRMKDTKSFVCSSCQRKFVSLDGLKYHESHNVCKKEAEQFVYKTCEICHKSFKTIAGYTYHISKKVCKKKLCRVCQKDEKDECIVICKICKNPTHLYCSDPPLDDFPEEDWFCSENCKNTINLIEKDKDQKLNEHLVSSDSDDALIIKPRRTLRKNRAVSESSASGEKDESDAENNEFVQANERIRPKWSNVSLNKIYERLDLFKSPNDSIFHLPELPTINFLEPGPQTHPFQSSNKIIIDNDVQTELPLFSSVSTVGNAGGPINGLDWSPQSFSSRYQFFAVAADDLSFHHLLIKAERKGNIIQIWCLDTENNELKCLSCITHDRNYVVDLKWSFMNVDKDCLGILAVIFGDFSCGIYCIPRPTVASLESTFPEFTSLLPLLSYSRFNKPTCLSWNPINKSFLLVGYADGSISLFNVDLTSKSFNPLCVFLNSPPALTQTVNCLSWCPFSEFVFVAGSRNGDLNYWDSREPMTAMFSKSYGQIAEHICMCWPSDEVFLLFVSQMGDIDFHLSVTCLSQGNPGTRTLHITESEIRDISMSQIINDSKKIVICDIKGGIYICDVIDTKSLLSNITYLDFKILDSLKVKSVEEVNNNANSKGEEAKVEERKEEEGEMKEEERKEEEKKDEEIENKFKDNENSNEVTYVFSKQLGKDDANYIIDSATCFMKCKWNPNESAKSWIVYGGRAGLLKCKKI